jgi:polyphosphate kinase 2 (PPK2 family)
MAVSGKDPARRAEPRIVSKTDYEKHLARLQTELVRMQEWAVHEGPQVMMEIEPDLTNRCGPCACLGTACDPAS